MSVGESFEFDTEHWCSGLRWVGTRALAPGERELILRHRVALERRLWGFAVAVPFGVLLPIAASFAIPAGWTPPWARVALAGAWLLCALLLPASLALRTRDVWRERSRFASDLDRGEVMRFEGPLDADDPIDEEQKRLFDAGYLMPVPGVFQALEVLPESGVVFRAGRRGELECTRVSVHETAPGPAYAMRVPVAQHIVRIEGAPEIRFLRRSLNPAEQAELTAHIRRLRRPGWPVVLWGVWIGAWALAAGADLETTLAYARGRWPWFAVQGALLAFALVVQLRALRLAGSLERDIRTGWALTFDRSPEGGNAPDRAATPMEFLPHSHVVWHTNGKPARWRNLRRAA